MRVYWEVEGYIPGDPPRYGKPRGELETGDIVFLHTPSDVIYYFDSYDDVPPPYSDWRHIGTYVHSEDEDLYPGVMDWLDRALESVFGVISGLTDRLDSLSDSIEGGVLDVQRYLGSRVNDLVDTGLSDLEAGIVVLEGLALVGVIGAELGVGSSLVSVLGWVRGKVEALWEATEDIRRTIAERIEAGRALYVRFAEYIHLERLREIDHILSLTWNDYYEKKLEVIRWMGDVSGELFGDVHVLNQWLALAGMVWKDYAAATGKTWGEQDMEWLAKTNSFLSDIEDELDYYARHPERLWIRIEDALVRPLYEARGEAYTGWDEDRAELRGWIGRVDNFYKTLDRKVLEYQLALPENIRDEMGPELIQFRKDLRETWKEGLVPVISHLRERLDLNEGKWIGYDRWKNIADPKITRSASLLSSPSVLTPENRTFQIERFTEIEAAIADDFQSFSIPLLEMEVPLYGDAVRKVLEGRE